MSHLGARECEANVPDPGYCVVEMVVTDTGSVAVVATDEISALSPPKAANAGAEMGIALSVYPLADPV